MSTDQPVNTQVARRTRRKKPVPDTATNTSTVINGKLTLSSRKEAVAAAKADPEDPMITWVREGWTIILNEKHQTHLPTDGAWLRVKRYRAGVGERHAIMEDTMQFDERMKRWYNDRGHCIDPSIVIAWKRQELPTT